MKGVRAIGLQHIYLFDDSFQNLSPTNALKQFLYFLKSKGNAGVINFSYSGDIDSVHFDLTIKENFILDAIPTSLIRDEENNLNEFLASMKNPYLVELINRLGPLTESMKDLPTDKLKLASLVKAFLSPSDFILLVHPDEYLNSKQIELIKSCIGFEAKEKKRMVFITPKNKDIWLDTATNLISKCEDTHTFLEHENPLISSHISKSSEEVLPFKKAS